MPAPQDQPENIDTGNDEAVQMPPEPCPSCGGRMIIIETFESNHAPRAPPPKRRTGTS